MSPNLRSSFLVLAALSLATVPAYALPPGYTLQPVHTNLTYPVAMRFAPDGRLFVLTKGGRVMVYGNAMDPAATLWATLPVDSSYERGLLGIDFHPQYPESAYVYFFYTNASPRENRVVRMWDNIKSGFGPWVLTTFPAAATYHHGGRVQFGPDGMLYVSYGDQQDPASAPDPQSVKGKIFRMTSMGTPAPGNPWGSQAVLKGIRNVYGLCFDKATGIGYFTENGPTCDDKIQHLVPGADYGWSETTSCGTLATGAEAPMLVYASTIAPTGCTVYRNALDADLDGCLLFGSYNDGTIRRARFDPSDRTVVASVDHFLEIPSDAILDVTVASDGILWLSTPTSIYRILPPAAVAGVGNGAPGARLAPAPNPFRGAVNLIAATDPSIERVEILDIGGRRVRSWSAPLPHALTWDGSDARGAQVPAGIYLVRAIGARGVRSGRVVRLTK